jgi:OOP family OmpA-OmpF porin
MRWNISFLFLFGVISTPVFASDPGAYVTGNVGVVNYVNAKNGLNNSSAPYPASLGFSGGYHVGPYLGIEGGYSRLFPSSIRIASSQGLIGRESVEGFSLLVAVVGTIPINDKFEMFGKVGLANTKIKYKFTPTNAADFIQSASSRKTNRMFSLGGQFNINRHYAIQAQYEELGEVRVNSVADVTTSALSLAGVYNF